MDISKKINDYKTKHKEGFTQLELSILLLEFPGMDKEKFHETMRGITVPMINNQIVYYRSDVEKAIACAVEKRDLKEEEWD